MWTSHAAHTLSWTDRTRTHFFFGTACCYLSWNGRGRLRHCLHSDVHSSSTSTIELLLLKSERFRKLELSIFTTTCSLLPLREILLAKFLFDVWTEGYETFVFFAVLCMITAKSDKLLANRTTSVSFSLAVLRVRHDTLHLLTRRKTTICISALTSVNQRLNAPLYWLLPSFLGVWLWATVSRRWTVIEIEAQSLHLVHMTHFLFARKTQIKILQTKR